MTACVYRYTFPTASPLDDVEAALVLALFATESLHGESQVRLETAHYFDLERRSCVIDAQTEVGRDLNRLFVGFLRREFGDDAFSVERVTTAPTSSMA